MKITKFLTMGIMILALNTSYLSAVNAQVNEKGEKSEKGEKYSTQTLVEKEITYSKTDKKLQPNLSSHPESPSAPQQSSERSGSTLKTVLKNIAFLTLGAAGLGATGILYFLFKVAQAGNPKLRSKRERKKDGLESTFLACCHSGNLSEVKNLLTEHKVNIRCQNNAPIGIACNSNHLEMVRYLLTSPDLKKHADIHASDDRCFKRAYQEGRMDLLNYLIFDYNIKETKEIKDFAIQNPQIAQMFEQRNASSLKQKKTIFS